MVNLGRGVPIWFFSFFLYSCGQGPKVDSMDFFRIHEIDSHSGTGRAVAIADMDGDRLPDVVGVTSDAVAWYKNPSWEKREVAKNLAGTNICVAPHDIDGDGLPELALGADWNINNTTGGGSLHILYRADDGSNWESHAIVQEPTLHRVGWLDMNADGAKELIVLPLKGEGSQPPYFRDPGVRILRFFPPEDPFTGNWPMEVIDDSVCRVAHGMCGVAWDEGGRDHLLVASLAGVSQFKYKAEEEWEWTQMCVGNPEPFPQCGAGEIGVGFYGDDEVMLGTIEPWHGHQAVVYTFKKERDDPVDRYAMWERHVVDKNLKGGHALEWADFDGDGYDEMLVGFREEAAPKLPPSLYIYDIEFDRESDPAFKWKKYVVEAGGLAPESVAVGDLNGDNRPDIVAIRNDTGNLRFYENLGKPMVE
jgi:hypothetical protein